MMQPDKIRALADYQDFGMDTDGNIVRVGRRMQKKLDALNKLGGYEQFVRGKIVLDVGCDMGFWSFLAAANFDAKFVVGIDRNRSVKNVGPTDLVTLNNETAKACHLFDRMEFHTAELGTSWQSFGRFDTVLLFSLYHHVYQAAGGDHAPIWYWLRQHLKDDGALLWENPWDLSDGVADAHVKVGRDHFDWEHICGTAQLYFTLERMTNACHELTRQLVLFRPLPLLERSYRATVKSGAGGASKAFAYADRRRCKEIERVLGFQPIDGSLNLELAEPFAWDRGYYRAQILDVVDRKDPRGLAQTWAPRWARFYPVKVETYGERRQRLNAYAFRFEGEKYRDNFVELIAGTRLRNNINGDSVQLIKEG